MASTRNKGRPSTYSEARGRKICERLADGVALVAICEESGMPGRKTVWRWLQKHEEFRLAYARARAFAMECEIDEIRSLADDIPKGASHEEVARIKLQIDTRRWRIVKLAPKTYGDRAELEVKETKTTYVVRMPEKAESTEAWVERWNSTYNRN